MSERTYWKGFRLDYVSDDPFWKALLKYSHQADRQRAGQRDANLVSSNVRKTRSRQLPIIDLDCPHEYIETSPGHSHLFLNTETTRPRWWLLMVGLYATGNIEKGFFYWSLRRGANFVRVPGTYKPFMGPGGRLECPPLPR